MKRRYFHYFVLLFIVGSIFFSFITPKWAQEQDSKPPDNLLDPLRKGAGELDGVEPMVPPSIVMTEEHLVRFLAVITAMNEVEVNNPDVDASIMSSNMLNALKNQSMTPDEYQRISDAIYYANITLKEQSFQLKPEADNEAFDAILSKHPEISEADKQSMRNSRAKNQGWYKGTKLAPLSNLELVDRYWKQINEGPRQDIRYYDKFVSS